MKKIINFLIGLFGILCVAVISFYIYKFFSFVWVQFASLDAGVAVGIISVVITVIISSISLAVGRYFERNQ